MLFYDQAKRMPSNVTNEDNFGVFGHCSRQQLVSFYQAYCPELLIVKQGIEETLVLQQQALVGYPVLPAKQVVDTTAAGEAFSAGFLAEFLSGASIGQALPTVNLLASQVILAAGAIVDTCVLLRSLLVPISAEGCMYE
ncbi:PfkB family carbohydrate kinase [Pseudoalteromonas ulvae]|uniref:adenosine kinase n=1 Tax=Pseudoalteromonas ulvae TaxID=107327 RepID=A0A244CM33_PSEDV|nr:PfkB family carbohydrate kinase [Pseudoalteromonas ulvae]OUL56652.1 hypothetical protein B1199_14845 [Pseudoalteromonas ulvae]